jgi:hypothetical protein
LLEIFLWILCKTSIQLKFKKIKVQSIPNHPASGLKKTASEKPIINLQFWSDQWPNDPQISEQSTTSYQTNFKFVQKTETANAIWEFNFSIDHDWIWCGRWETLSYQGKWKLGPLIEIMNNFLKIGQHYGTRSTGLEIYGKHIPQFAPTGNFLCVQ